MVSLHFERLQFLKGVDFSIAISSNKSLFLVCFLQFIDVEFSVIFNIVGMSLRMRGYTGKN